MKNEFKNQREHFCDVEEFYGIAHKLGSFLVALLCNKMKA